MKIYKISQNKILGYDEALNKPFRITTETLNKIIKNIGNKVNLFSGNCGVFAIGLSKFLKDIGNYNLQYMIYVNSGEKSLENYFDGEPDIYHVILSVEGNGIDDFFDGRGSCDDSDILSILKEYGQNFETVTTIKLPVDNGRVETFIRSNTNYNSSSINEHGILELLKQELFKLKDQSSPVILAKRHNVKIYRIAKDKIKTDKKPWEMTEDEFIDYHKTGYIRENAYDKYKTTEGLNWLNKSKYPILHSTKQFGDKTIEFRKSGEKQQYVKHTPPDKDGFEDILRDSQGMAIMLSDEEAIEKGYKLYDTTIVAFDGDIAIGLASDEWGADGVWVVEAYQHLGIGVYLLSELRKQFDYSRHIGQMTNAGENMSRAYYRKLLKEKNENI